jgi:hypothetical protein
MAAHDATQISGNTLTQGGLSRPGSAYVLFGGDKSALKDAKNRIGIRNSR